MVVTAVGEILVDMTQTHIDANGIPHFAANPGGAPANGGGRGCETWGKSPVYRMRR